MSTPPTVRRPRTAGWGFRRQLPGPLVLGADVLLATLGIFLVLLGGAGCASREVETAPDFTLSAAVAPPTATPNMARDVARGKRLAQDKGCLGCHTVDGRDQVGPTWKGLYGKTETLEGGGRVEVNDEYLEESIARPNAKEVQGFLPDIMPAIELNREEINAIIAYIKSLR